MIFGLPAHGCPLLRSSSAKGAEKPNTGRGLALTFARWMQWRLGGR